MLARTVPYSPPVRLGGLLDIVVETNDDEFG